MAKERISNGGRAFHLLVTVAGSSLWLYTAVSLLRNYALQDQLIMLAVTLLILAVSMIQLTFPFPSGLKSDEEAP